MKTGRFNGRGGLYIFTHLSPGFFLFSPLTWGNETTCEVQGGRGGSDHQTYRLMTADL